MFLHLIIAFVASMHLEQQSVFPLPPPLELACPRFLSLSVCKACVLRSFAELDSDIKASESIPPDIGDLCLSIISLTSRCVVAIPVDSSGPANSTNDISPHLYPTFQTTFSVLAAARVFLISASTILCFAIHFRSPETRCAQNAR